MKTLAIPLVILLSMWHHNCRWAEAVRAEEELWASLEIQRVWRGCPLHGSSGLSEHLNFVTRLPSSVCRLRQTPAVSRYLGRVKWEAKYEEVPERGVCKFRWLALHAAPATSVCLINPFTLLQVWQKEMAAVRS